MYNTNHFFKGIKIKLKPYMIWANDYDYIKKLSKEEKEFIAQFHNEYYNGRFDLRYRGKQIESIFLNDKRITGLYIQAKQDPEQFKELKELTRQENDDRKRKYNKHKSREFDYFSRFVNCKDLAQKEKHLKSYNKIFCTKYTMDAKIPDFKPSNKIPKKYKHLSIKEFIKVSIYRELNNQYSKRNDATNREIDLNYEKSLIYEYKDEVYNDRLDTQDLDDLRSLFLEKAQESDYIGFVFEALLYVCDLLNNKDYVILVLENKELYENKALSKAKTYLSLYRLLKVLEIENHNDPEVKEVVKILRNTYETIIFPKSKKLRQLKKNKELEL